MTPTQELIAARALITRPDNFTTGIRKAPNGFGGISFCALGALDEARGLDAYCTRDTDKLSKFDTPAVVRLAAALPQTFAPREYQDARVALYNNTMGHAATLNLFDRAIARGALIDGLLAPTGTEPTTPSRVLEPA